MTKVLTTLAVEKMQPGPARREIPDGRVSGLYLIVQPSGAKSWAIRYRSNGVTRKHTIESYPKVDLLSARELAQRALVDVAKGSDPGSDKKAKRVAAKAAPSLERDLIDKVIDTFVERHAKANTKAASAKETERLLKKEVLSAWKGRRLPTIARADVHELLDGIVDRGAPILANRVLAALRRMCGWAVERGLIEVSPCEKIKAPSAERSRDRVLSDDELKAVWISLDTIGQPFGPLFKLLILTGQRRDEVADMRWSEVDLEAKVWVIPRERSKNDQAHTVPLSDQAVAILAALPRIGEKGFVFTTSGKTAVTGFSRAKERIDRLLVGDGPETKPALPRWTLHDLRRTFASGAARLGINMPVIEKVLNHTSGSFSGVAGVYQRHSFSDEKRHALQAWAGFVDRLTAETPAVNVLELARAS